MGWPREKSRGPRTKKLDVKPQQACEDDFKHLFSEDYAYLYDAVCKRSKSNVRTPLQELIAIVKRTVEISELNVKKYGGKKDEKVPGSP